RAAPCRPAGVAALGRCAASRLPRTPGLRHLVLRGARFTKAEGGVLGRGLCSTRRWTRRPGPPKPTNQPGGADDLGVPAPDACAQVAVIGHDEHAGGGAGGVAVPGDLHDDIVRRPPARVAHAEPGRDSRRREATVRGTVEDKLDRRLARNDTTKTPDDRRRGADLGRTPA